MDSSLQKRRNWLSTEWGEVVQSDDRCPECSALLFARAQDQRSIHYNLAPTSARFCDCGYVRDRTLQQTDRLIILGEAPYCLARRALDRLTANLCLEWVGGWEDCTIAPRWAFQRRLNWRPYQRKQGRQILSDGVFYVAFGDVPLLHNNKRPAKLKHIKRTW